MKRRVLGRLGSLLAKLMGTVLVLGVAAGAAVIVARSSQGDHTDLFDAATGAGGSATTTGDSSQVATTPTSRPPTVTDPLPPDGSVAFMVGQDSSTLGLLRLEAPSLPEPYGVVLNVGLAPPASMLAGVPPAGTVGLPSSAATLDVAAGITDVATTLADYPDSALVLGLSLADGTCSNDVALALVGQPTTGAQASTQGDLFSAIDRMSAYFAGLAPRAVYLKIGYEFEGGWNCYFPSLYVQAYRVVAERVAAIAPDVQFVWQAAAHPRADFAPPSDHVEGEIPLATLRDYRFNGQADPAAGFPATDPGFGQGVLNAWYPGDDVVDWVGFSYVGGSNFSAQWGPVVTSYSPRDQQQAVLAFAREHAKPVMIGQASPLGYDLAQSSFGDIFASAPPQPLSADSIWLDWFSELFVFVSANSDVIRAVTYVNTPWQSMPQWRCTGEAGSETCPGSYYGDSRIQANPALLEKLVAQLDADGWATAPPP